MWTLGKLLLGKKGEWGTKLGPVQVKFLKCQDECIVFCWFLQSDDIKPVILVVPGEEASKNKTTPKDQSNVSQKQTKATNSGLCLLHASKLKLEEKSVGVGVMVLWCWCYFERKKLNIVVI